MPEGLLSGWLRARRLAAARPFVTGRVLDAGCGIGELAAFVDPDRYLGFDPNAQYIATARQRHPRHRFEADGPHEGQYDTVVSLAVIEHIEDPAGFLRNLAERLAPQGRLVISTPHPRFERLYEIGARLGLFNQHASDDHEDLLDRRRLDMIGKEAGLRLSRYRRFLFGANQLAVYERA